MQNKRVFKIATESLSTNRIVFLVLMIFKIISVGMGIIVPYLVGEVIDHLETISIQKIAILIVLSAISLIIESTVTYRFALLGQKAAIHVRKCLWNKILNLEPKYYDRVHSGELSSRIINDTLSLSDFLTSILPDFYASVLTLILMIIILLSLDVWLGIVFCMVFPIIILVMLLVSNKVRNLAIIQQEIYAKLNEIFTETLEHIKFVKAYNAEKSEEKNCRKNV